MFLEAKVQKLHETCEGVLQSIMYFHQSQFTAIDISISWKLCSYHDSIYKIAKGGQRGQSLKYLKACFQCIYLLTFLSESWDKGNLRSMVQKALLFPTIFKKGEEDTSQDMW